MSNLIPMQSLTPDGVRATLAELLETPRPVAEIADWLLAVDWSLTKGPPDPDVYTMLGVLEGLTTEVDEGDITRERFIAAIRAMADGSDIEPTGRPALRSLERSRSS